MRATAHDRRPCALWARPAPRHRPCTPKGGRAASNLSSTKAALRRQCIGPDAEQAEPCSNSGGHVPQCAAAARPHGAGVSRRVALLAGGALAGMSAHRPQGQAAFAAAPGTSTALAARLDAPTLVSPGSSLFTKPGLVTYPRWMFGTWRCTSTFDAFETPLGPAFVDASLLAAARAPLEQGGLGSSAQYELRFFSTLPDTFENQVRFALGVLPEDQVVADRAFNTRSMTNAYLDWDAVASVQYDPRAAPDRQTLEFQRVSPDMRPLPARRIEQYINNVLSEEGLTLGEAGQPRYTLSELSRQVTIGERSVDVTDYEVITDYVRSTDGNVQARQVTAVYLDARHPRYFEARGRAVAVYRYSLSLSRQLTPVYSGTEAVCVQTPKDVVQCV